MIRNEGSKNGRGKDNKKEIKSSGRDYRSGFGSDCPWRSDCALAKREEIVSFRED